MRCAALAVLVACSSAAPATHVRSAEDPPVGHALGMNDVSILLPLPSNVGIPVLAALAGDEEALAELRRVDALVTAPGDIAPRTGATIAFDDFQIVAVRFDVCERLALGPCPVGAAGRLRLVLQPLYVRAGATFAHDVALHAFYPIPAAEMSSAVDELRRLSRIQHEPASAPLAVGPAAAAGNADYLRGLRALVLRYARATNLVRLTVIGQVADSAAFAWIFRGIDREGDELVPMIIPGIAAAQQTVQLAGGDAVYRTDQIADVPSGFTLATNGPPFAAATSEQRAAALAALTEVQNPERTRCGGMRPARRYTSRTATRARC